VRHFGERIKAIVGRADMMVISDVDRHIYNAVWVPLVQADLTSSATKSILFAQDRNQQKKCPVAVHH